MTGNLFDTIITASTKKREKEIRKKIKKLHDAGIRNKPPQ